MNKGELIDALCTGFSGGAAGAGRPVLSRAQITRALDAVLDTVAARLARGEAAYWPDVGVMRQVAWSARNRFDVLGWSGLVAVPARCRINFRPCDALREAVN